VDTVRRQLEQAEKLAETEPLTGLLNRRGMEKRLEDAIAARQRFCIVLFDLDRFKAVNDRHGHAVGDELLKDFARRLSSQFRPGDSLSRWGGDEFLALMQCELRDAVSRGGRIAHSSCGSYTVEAGGREYRIEISASVGVAEHKPGQSARDLIALADKLMYQSKGAPTGG
jgi:diguanylate cyclase (GGDEF)-like protein